MVLRNDLFWSDTPIPAWFSYFISCSGQQSISFIELTLSPSIFPTASRRYHVKLLSEQLKLHSIPPLLFLTSGDTVTVDLSSPIKEEVSHFSAPGCQHSFLSLYSPLKVAILREIKSWRIEQHCTQIVASLTTLETTLDVCYGVLLPVARHCLAEEKLYKYIHWCCTTVRVMAITFTVFKQMPKRR